MNKKELGRLIERQCDFMACGTQNPEFLRNDDGTEPEMREMLRLNLEQFAGALIAVLQPNSSV